MRSAHHPNILPLLACFLAGCPENPSSSPCSSWLWLVLPYISGGSMLTLLQSSYHKVGLLTDTKHDHRVGPQSDFHDETLHCRRVNAEQCPPSLQHRACYSNH